MRKYIISFLLILLNQSAVIFSNERAKSSNALISETMLNPSISNICNINASTIKKGEFRIVEGVLYVCVIKDGKIIYTKTNDKKFETKEGLSINSSLFDFFKTYGTDIKFEIGTCMYLELSDGWRACLSNSYALDFSMPILYFYKIDTEYSRTMNLEDYINFMKF